MFSSGIFVENSTNITFAGNTALCPRCGGIGDVPDGTFDVIGNTIRVLSAPGYTRERLGRLADLIRQQQAAKADPAETVETLAREAPELAPFFDRLRRSPEAVAAWLAILLSVIQLLMSVSHSPATPEDVQRITEQAIQQCVQDPSAEATD